MSLCLGVHAGHEACSLCAPCVGEELTQSYFPIIWSLEERRKACREQYGFDCSCPRCQVRGDACWHEGPSDVAG